MNKLTFNKLKFLKPGDLIVLPDNFKEKNIKNYLILKDAKRFYKTYKDQYSSLNLGVCINRKYSDKLKELRYSIYNKEQIYNVTFKAPVSIFETGFYIGLKENND